MLNPRVRSFLWAQGATHAYLLQPAAANRHVRRLYAATPRASHQRLREAACREGTRARIADYEFVVPATSYPSALICAPCQSELADSRWRSTIRLTVM